TSCSPQPATWYPTTATSSPYTAGYRAPSPCRSSNTHVACWTRAPFISSPSVAVGGCEQPRPSSRHTPLLASWGRSLGRRGTLAQRGVNTAGRGRSYNTFIVDGGLDVGGI